MKRIKHILLALWLLTLPVVTAMAGVSLSMKDFKVISGQTYTVEVALENDVALDAISGTLTIPEGLTYVANSFTASSRISAEFSATYVASTKKFSIINFGSAKIAVGTGTVFSFQVTAGNIAEPVTINLSGLKLSDAQGNNVATSTTAAATVSAVSSTTAELEADPTSLEMGAGDESTIALTLTCPAYATTVGAGMTIELPNGLSLVEGSQTKGAMLAPSHAISINKVANTNNYNVVIISSLQDAFTQQYAELLSFKVKATGEVLAGSDINITNIAVAAKSGQETAIADLTIAAKADAAEYTLTSATETVDLVGTEEATVTLKATFPMEKTAAGMTITLPENVELVANSQEKGSLLAGTHSVSMSPKSGSTNTYNVVIISSTQAVFTAQEGGLFSFKVKATGEVAANAKIQVSDILFSSKAGVEDGAEALSIDLTYDAGVTLGDVNGDGDIDTVDATYILMYLVDNAPENFVEAAADVNGDGNIDTKDVTAILKSLVE